MIITGAGGFALQLFDTLAELNMENEVVFFDDSPKSENRFIYEKFPVINSLNEALEHLKKDNRFVLGTGCPATRQMFFNKFINLGGQPISIISPSASIGKYNIRIGSGVTILRNVVIESNVSIGDGCLINLNTTITHGCNMGNFCELSPGVTVAGNVQIGNYTQIGSGVIILPNISVGKNVIVAAGAVINTTIPDKVMIAGIPAVIKKEL